ncbi:MAG: hypothetical protein ACOY94_22950 [Bacillota bacterium]
MAACWKISPGRDGEMLSTFLSRKIMAVRYREFGDIRAATKEQVRALARPQGFFWIDECTELRAHA